jgi:hypothetical protein
MLISLIFKPLLIKKKKSHEMKFGVQNYAVISTCSGSYVVSIKQNVNYNFQPPAMLIWLVSHNSGFKSCSSSENLSAYNISWPHVDWCKFYIHFRSLSIHHFGMGDTMQLKVITLRSPSKA